MIEQDQFDGFISKRDDGHLFASDLIDKLLHEREIKVAHQVNATGPDHVEAARQLIESTHFTIVVIGPSKLASSTGREKSFQQLEIEAALAHYRECLRNEKFYELFFVNLTDQPSAQETDDFNELIGQLPFSSRTFHHVYSAPTQRDHDPRRWNDSVDKIAHAVSYSLAKDGIVPVGRQSPFGHQGADRVDFTPGERSYIDHSLKNWLKGQTDRLELVEGPTVDAERMRHALFAFEPKRCIILDARILPGEEETVAPEDERKAGGKDARYDSHPILRTIFDDYRRPLMVTGPPGAGKTTSLTTSAALMAGRASKEFRARIDDLMKTEMAKIIDEIPPNAPAYIPIVFRATALASEMGTQRKDPWDDFDTLTDFLNKLLNDGREPTETVNEARAKMRDRLEEQPYAIFIDALDEVLYKSVSDRILKMAKHAYLDFEQKKLPIKFVLSTRQHLKNDDDTHDVLLDPLRIDQIEAYIDRVGRSLASPSSNEMDRFTIEAKTALRQHDSLLEFISQPFNLNCFCWLSWQDWRQNGSIEAPRSETAFFQMIIGYLIEGQNLKDPDGNELPMGMLRLILRRLAYDALNSDDGKSRLTVQAAEALCEHTLSRAYAYVRNDGDMIKIRPGYARELLTNFTQGTDLLQRNDKFYEFPKVRFCEYLAGERIDSDALTTASLQTLRHEKLEHVLSSMKFCYALRVMHEVPEYANNVLNGLLSRADQAVAVAEQALKDKDPSADTHFFEAFDWLNAALECYSSGIDANFTGNGRSEPDEIGYLMVRGKTWKMLEDHGKRLEISQRAKTISLLLRLGRRSDAAATVQVIQNLFGNIMGMGHIASRWIPISIPISEDADAEVREILLERTPVLVCEFEEFLTSDKSHQDVWTHAENPEDLRIDSCAAGESDSIPPEEIWRRQRRNPGNPVTYVTWYEAVAYAKWMTKHDPSLREGEYYRLPTEFEMYAISKQLAGENSYPWGDKLSRGKAAEVNWRGAEIGDASPPGTFPPIDVYGSQGLVGKLVDFGSNVRVWAIDTAKTGEPAWNVETPISEDAWQFVAGWSWIDREEFAYALNRGERFRPTDRDRRIGIRLVCDRQNLN